MRKNVVIAGLLLFLAAAPRGVAGSKGKSQNPATDSSEIAVVRLINAAEASYFQQRQRYASFAELVDSGEIQRAAFLSADYARAMRLLHLGSESQPLDGFSLNLMVSANAGGYHLYLTQRGERCGTGWFTDETGILYGGTAVDCQQSTAAAANGWSPSDIDALVPPVRSDVTCPLPQILHDASERASELVENLQRFTATERIEHIEYGKNGKQRNTTDRQFNYVAQIEQNSSGGFWVEEYRSATKEDEHSPLSDTGTAAFALIFHPRVIGNFEMRCEGQTDFHGTPAWQLRFEESADPAKSFHQIRINKSTYQLRFKGRAWIAADTAEVLRLQTDLVAPVPQIKLQVEHLDISYAPVEFDKRKFRLWLPETASMHISYRGHRYQRLHNFSHFQLFLVDTEQRIKQPDPAPSSGQ